jgi:hypothetical protein
MDEDVENYMDETVEPPDCETQARRSEGEQPAAYTPIVPVGDPTKPTKPVKTMTAS